MKYILTALCCVTVSTIISVIIFLQFKPQTPEITISEEGFWVINGTVTDVSALGIKGSDGDKGDAGEKGDDGKSPTVEINEDGYWVINGTVTNVKASPDSPEDDSGGLDFFLKDDGSYAVAIGKAKYLSEVEIPSVYNNKKVTSISAYGFAETKIRSLRIPDSITEIGEGAFYGCKNLSSVTVGKGVNKIAKGAFENCKSILEIYDLSPTLQFTKSANTEGYIAYYALDIYESENDPSKLVCQGDFIFRKDENENLLAAYLGDDTDIKLPEGCGGEGYKIRDKLFYQNATVKSVNIPSAVTSIGASCFGGCTSLEYVIIGSGVAHIGNSAFPSSLEAFYYTSTESDWMKIQFEDGNDIVKFLTKYYSSTQPAENAKKYWYYSENKPILWN